MVHRLIPPRILQLIEYHYGLVKDSYPEMSSESEGCRVLLKQSNDAIGLIENNQGSPITDIIGLAVACIDYLETFYKWGPVESYPVPAYRLGVGKVK